MNDTKDTAGNVGSFLENHKGIIIIISAIIIAGIVGFLAYSGITKTLRKNGLEKLDVLTVELTKAESEDEVDASVVDDILTRAKALADSSNGVVATRAYMFAADIDFANKNWEYSKESWLNAAKASESAYTAPICYYNAAVCSEEVGNIDDAIAYYTIAVGKESFSLAPRAYFNIGRIEEQRGGFEAAEKAYNTLVDNYAGNEWANLAKSRLLTLKAEGKLAN
ncbi:MAG: hypothetical protein BKP49_01145 [Treponema sp. CETP13]|nr:MAG: hypothetical protein BKP49_01145 [Treponema sp. CETP13]